MARALTHRGPDDMDVWLDESVHLTLSHRRLSIIDLSPDGRQPMVSACGRYVLTYNGEIYNYQHLRTELEETRAAPSWRGRSDTEVLLAALSHWGVADTLRRLNGMFAFALWDRREHLLSLARDRFGEKPLYYGWQNGTFMFASELGALAEHPAFRRTLETSALALYLRFGYVPSPHSIYKDIYKLEPAHFLSLRLPRCGDPLPQRYWTVPVPQPAEPADEQATAHELENVLRKAVSLRLQSDVPLGAFLSGGIDSSTVVALAQASSSKRVQTFSIGFREAAHDESAYASQVAAALGTDHTSLYVSARDALDVVPLLPDIYDEPFADSSQIPTYLLAKLTREHVTVAMSGDGGDELFGGYNRYSQGRRLLAINSVVPAPVRTLAAATLRSVPSRRWDDLLAMAPRSAAVLLGGDRLSKVARALDAQDSMAMYKRFVSQWQEPLSLLRYGTEPPTVIDRTMIATEPDEAVSWMMYLDQLTYMPDDILVKVDRASMAVGLEARVPFLDPGVVSFAARLPMSFKMRNGIGKWLVRRVLDRYLDQKLLSRPKQGFAIPLAAWLRGPLREWADDLLNDATTNLRSIFQGEVIRAAWSSHLSGRANVEAALWAVLMFNAWYRRYEPNLDEA